MSVNRLLANLAQSLDSSSVGSFLSGDSSDRFQTLQWTDVSGRPTVADSATTTSIIDSAYVQSRVTTYTVGLDSATTIALLDSDYIRSKANNDVGFFIYHYDTTAGQTLLDSSNEASNNAISYTEDYLMVFKNGVLLADSSDYTATSGDTIVLTSGTDSGEVVTVVKWSAADPSPAVNWYGDRAISASGHYNSGGVPWGRMNYFDIMTHGNSSAPQFGYIAIGGSSNVPRLKMGGGGVSNSTYCLWAGGSAGNDDIFYVTASTGSNSSDFGLLTTNRSLHATFSNGTTGCWSGGNSSWDGSGTFLNSIDKNTIATPGNATDFGDLSSSRYRAMGASHATYGVVGGGQTTQSAGNVNTIDYYTTATPSNATDFGDLTVSRGGAGAAGNGTYAVFVGSDVMDYVTVATPANATDFGDFTASNFSSSGSFGVTGNETRGCFGGGDLLYFTFDTPSNAVSYGTSARIASDDFEANSMSSGSSS